MTHKEQDTARRISSSEIKSPPWTDSCLPHKITLILQPKGSSLCGQACVAMAAHITLDESIRLFGHNASKTKDLVRALNSLGISTPSGRLKRFSQRKRWPQRAIIREIWIIPGRKKNTIHIGGHFILLWDDYIYDPDPHKPPGVYASYLTLT